MYKFYLLESAFSQVGVDRLQANLIELNEAMVSYPSPTDEYFYSNTFWDVLVAQNVTMTQCLYCLPNQQFCRVILPLVLKKLHIIDQINDYTGLCRTFPKDINAFWGVVFTPKNKYDLSTKTELSQFRYNAAKNNVSHATFKRFKSVLFKKIVFCDSAYQYLASYSPAEFNQIISRLLELDRYNQTWSQGVFAPSHVTLGSNLKVSYESTTTNNNPKLSALRWFKLPDGRKEYFEPHIKMGNMRIHFFPDNNNHTIYVGYIGPHLPV